MKIKPRKTDPYLKLPFPFNSIDSLTCSTMPHTTVEHKRLVKIFNGCSSAGSCPTRFRDRPLAKLSEGGGGGVGAARIVFENKSFSKIFPLHDYFLGLFGVHEFFSFNFPLRECFFCTSPARPISFLMVRPLPLGRLGNAGDNDRRSNPQESKQLCSIAVHCVSFT